METFVLLAGLLLLIIYLITKNELIKVEEIKRASDLSDTEIKDWTNYEEKLILNIFNYVSKKTFQRITYTNKDYIIMSALMYQESRKDFASGKKNYEVIGDGGKSFGYFQVGKSALTDVNKEWKSNFTINDLLDENVNILIASRYLYLCYHRNNKEKDYYKKLWLAYKRYNGGRDETYNSINPQATKYANEIIKHYSKIERILKYYKLI